MKVLVTGACGAIGKRTVEALLSEGHRVRGVDRPTRSSRRCAARMRRRYGTRIEYRLGDLRTAGLLESSIADVGSVVHLAAILPPAADRDPRLSEQINVGVTERLVRLLEKMCPSPRLVFTSSIAVYGDRLLDPVIRPTDPPAPNADDPYAQQKVRCEQTVRSSTLKWVILRLSYIVEPRRMVMDPLMYRMPLETPIEPCLAEDVALVLSAAAAAVDERFTSRTLLIAGGAQMRTSYREYLDSALHAFGLGGLFLPPRAFADSGFHCAYMDTDESSSIVPYQRHSLSDLFRTIRRAARWRRVLLTPLRPAARLLLLGRSPFYRAYLAHTYRHTAQRIVDALLLCVGLKPKTPAGV